MPKTLSIFATFLTALVALEHIGFMILEMFFWDHPIGRGVFDMSEAFAQSTAFMAKNQGLYNGFLAAGLLWGMLSKKRDVIIFFLSCVVIAGIYGALTVSPKIAIVQALPAALGLALMILGWRGKAWEKP